MENRSQKFVLVAALLIAVIAGSFFFFVQDYASTSSTRIEDPYVRTENAPPSAINDETSHPDLANDSETPEN